MEKFTVDEIACIASLLFWFGLFLGVTGKRDTGRMIKSTVTLPDVLFTVFHSNKSSTLIREQTTRKREYFISTDLFPEPVRPGDVVKKARNTKQHWTALGYKTVLVKDVSEE